MTSAWRYKGKVIHELYALNYDVYTVLYIYDVLYLRLNINIGIMHVLCSLVYLCFFPRLKSAKHARINAYMIM